MNQIQNHTTPEGDEVGTHDDFKIIINGRELPYPASRLFALFAVGFFAGYLMAVILR